MTQALLEEARAGSKVDGFTIGRSLHRGAMGELLAVTRDGEPGALVMKVPRFGIADSNELLLAFETEALILRRLRGSYTPRFVAAGDVTRVPYLVTEWIDGRSLDLRESRSMPPQQLVPIAARIADALHAIHIQGVVHHDLKPDNVVMKPDGRAVLVDFGLAHHRDLPDLLAQERRFTAGSAPYVSPEQVRGRRGDPRSDLFGLGVLMYELATGELPFGIPLTPAGLRDRLWKAPVPPRALVPTMEPALQEIILRCLEPSAERRYQSAAHVAFDLRHLSGVGLTRRAHYSKRAPFLSQVLRWWNARELGGVEPLRAGARPARVVMAAVDTMHPEDPRQPQIQRETRRLLETGGEYRLICVSVIPSGQDGDAAREHRIRLRYWVDPLQVAADRISLHVLESGDAAGALLGFANANHVDLIILGAPGPDEKAFAWWRSVASAVTANAECSVHVVRR